MAVQIKKLTKNLSKKTGIPMKDLEGILRVISYEIVEELREHHKFEFPGFGLFYCTLSNTKILTKVYLCKEAYERLNRNDGERRDEIIFE